MPIELQPDGIYHGVYPGTDSGAEDAVTPQSLSDYESAAGRRAAWVYFSHDWFNGRGFPLDTAGWIRDGGRVPFIRLMLRSSNENPCPDPVYTLDAINAGDFDRDLAAWGKGARDFSHPVIIEWGTEVNGKWFAWNGKWNGKQKGPERFKDAFRRIVRLIREDAGARNVTWVFHATDADDPSSNWNRMENYYPGPDFIDWVGASVYGAQEPKNDEPCSPFAPAMTEVRDRLTALAPRKPVFLLEFGATANHPQAGTDKLCRPHEWAASALEELIVNNRWPEVRGFSWWNESWPNDGAPRTEMRVQELPELGEVFRRYLVNNPRVLDRLGG